MIVMKFGGTSVGKVEAFQQVARIVAQAMMQPVTQPMAQPMKRGDSATMPMPGVVVVTSAMSGVTNLLIDAAQRAANGDENFYREAAQNLRAKHLAVAEALVADTADRSAVMAILDERLQEFTRLCSSIAVLGELTQRGLDVVSGLGERMSAPLLAAVLRGQGLQAEYVDATELIVTDRVFGGAAPRMEQTEERCRARLLPLVEAGIIPVVTGFIGATEDGIPTTLGRGGSDYSGAIIGAALQADEIQIWTDVNGVMTADPRIVPNARSLNQLSYEEMAELAYYGAKVLHPKTVTPAIEKNIPLRVLNTFQPEHPGTRIVHRGNDATQGGVKAITSIRNMNLITVAGRGMIGVPGIAARTFTSVARVGANVLMISQSSSEQSICFVVPEESAQAIVLALREEFKSELNHRYIDEISAQPRISIIAVVGSGMRGTPGLAAGVFKAVGNKQINVIAIAQGSSEANISLVVTDDDTAAAVMAIHDMFELDKPIQERSQSYLTA